MHCTLYIFCYYLSECQVQVLPCPVSDQQILGKQIGPRIAPPLPHSQPIIYEKYLNIKEHDFKYRLKAEGDVLIQI